MHYYLFQIVTKDLSLMLRTEVSASTIKDLQQLAQRKTDEYKLQKGMVYRIFRYDEKSNGLETTLIKQGVITDS